jgi:phosphopantetheinyl transferase
VRKPARVLLWLGRRDSGVALPEEGMLSAEEWSWSKTLAPERRRNYCQTRARLRVWLADLWNCATLAVPLLSPPGQPPRLSGDQAFISLSHSGDGLLLGLSAEPIGVDLEAAARPLVADALMRRFFPPAEVRQLQRLEGTALRQAVLTSWLLKEAAIKWRRSSLAAELSEWQLDHDTGQLHQLRLGLEPEGRSGWLGPWGWAAVGSGVERAQWMQGAGAG